MSMRQLRIISLGGFARVTNNMFVYEIPGGDILIVDCGFGFPSEEMFGVDLVIPDTSYLKGKEARIRGIILTHGHEDHTGALPYILPRLGRVPIYGSRLTTALVRQKLQELAIGAVIEEVSSDTKLSLGNFNISFAQVTHSIPDTFNLLIETPAGRVYHASDFKFDFTPVDGKQAEIGKIASFGNMGIDLLLSDCLRAEKEGATPSETKLSEMFDREITKTQGKFLMTTMSSNISRLQQAIDASIANGRKVALVGRSIEETARVAARLEYLRLPKEHEVPPRLVQRMPPQKIALLVAGAQAQAGSALEKIALGDHRFVKLKEGDKVVFSTDYIPGSEIAIHALIDALVAKGASVSYSEIMDDLHVSGHGSQVDLSLMISLTRPQFIVPIGGTLRHMKQYQLLARRMGYERDKIFLPEEDQTIELVEGKAKIGGRVSIRDVLVDGMGVGDVGEILLRDRQVLAKEGIVVVVAQREKSTGILVGTPDVISRGFLFGGSSQKILSEAAKRVGRRFGKKRFTDAHFMREEIISELEPFFWEETGRRPMILPVIVEV